MRTRRLYRITSLTTAGQIHEDRYLTPEQVELLQSKSRHPSSPVVRVEPVPEIVRDLP